MTQLSGKGQSAKANYRVSGVLDDTLLIDQLHFKI